MEDLLEEVQASEAELKEGLKQMEAVYIDGDSLYSGLTH